MHDLVCVECGAVHELDVLYGCPACGGILEVRLDHTAARNELESRGGVARYDYQALLPVRAELVSPLSNVPTPLIEAPRLARRLGLTRLWLKLELANPTGSFKDRPILVGVAKALEFGFRTVVAASSGNASAAVAAYAARYGLNAIILIPAATAPAKVAQTAFYGARVIKVDGPYSNSFQLVRKLAESHPVFNLTTTFINPYTVSGDKLVAYELLDQLERAVPDDIFVPVGAGPLLAGIHGGYLDACGLGWSTGVPRMVAVQAETCAPVVRAFDAGEDVVQPVHEPGTIAGGIADGLVGYPQDGAYTLRIIRQSGGHAVAVPDSEILQAQQWLATDEGVFAEPSAASAVAGIARAAEAGLVERDALIIAIMTGHGLKDMSVAQEAVGAIPTVPCDYASLLALVPEDLLRDRGDPGSTR
jgi:threonine synthase